MLVPKRVIEWDFTNICFGMQRHTGNRDLLSSRIKRLNDRYLLREFPNISTKGQLNGLKLIENTCNPTLNHIKPVCFLLMLVFYVYIYEIHLFFL